VVFFLPSVEVGDVTVSALLIVPDKARNDIRDVSLSIA
jgi:hypothetical protein